MGKYILHITQIIEGWTKWTYDVVMFHKNKTADKRLAICYQCEHREGSVCGICGCVLKPKVRVNYFLDENGKSVEGCPEKKW